MTAMSHGRADEGLEGLPRARLRLLVAGQRLAEGAEHRARARADGRLEQLERVLVRIHLHHDVDLFGLQRDRRQGLLDPDSVGRQQPIELGEQLLGGLDAHIQYFLSNR